MFIIPGKPIPLARPRLGKNTTYDSQKKHKLLAGINLKCQMRSQIPPKCPLSIEIAFFMPIPSHISKKKKQLLEGQPHHKKPDIDNLIKFVLDVANGILFIDDSVICKIVARKVYSNQPRTEVCVSKFQGDEYHEERSPTKNTNTRGSSIQRT